MGKASKRRMESRPKTSSAETAAPADSKAGASSDVIASLLGAAAAHVDALDMEAAISVYQRVLEAAPGCVAALDGLGDACLQAGEREQAIAALSRSVELVPEGGVERYMNLGQLSEGAVALGWFERGVAQLRERCSAATNDDERVAAANALATALSSVTEVFLTDACDEPDAEARCEAAAGEAVALVQALPVQTLVEPYAALASVRLSQSRDEEAKASPTHPPRPPRPPPRPLLWGSTVARGRCPPATVPLATSPARMRAPLTTPPCLCRCPRPRPSPSPSPSP